MLHQIKHSELTELIDLKLGNWNQEHLHECLTPEFPDHRLQNKEYRTPSKGHFIGVTPSVCAPSASPAPWWCQQKVFGECQYFFVLVISLFITHFSRCGHEEKGIEYSASVGKDVISAFFPNRLDKLITHNFFFFFYFLSERVGHGSLRKPH